MTDNNSGFDQWVELWQQGQESFIDAQTKMAEQFKTSIESISGLETHSPAEQAANSWQNLIKAWTPGFDKAGATAGFDGSAFDFRHNQNAFFDLLDPQQWTVYAPEQLRVMLQSIADGPRFADLQMPQLDAAGAWRETLDYQQAAADMAKVMQQAWTEAYGEFSKQFTTDDLKEGNVNGALDAWLTAANASLLKAQSSDEFLNAQKRMVRSSTEIRARQRKVAENWSEAWQMPTRSEIDDLVLMMHEMRREMRALKQEVERLKGGR